MDLTRREFYLLTLMFIVVVLMGVYPDLFLDYIHSSTVMLI